MEKKCLGPDVDPAAFFLLRRDVASLFRSSNSGTGWSACHFLGSVLLV